MRHSSDRVVSPATPGPDSLPVAPSASSRWTVPRPHLTAALYGMILVNGLAPEVARAIAGQGFLSAALAGFQINAIELIAGFVGLWRVSAGEAVPARLADVAAAALIALLVVVPSVQVTWMALGLLALAELARPSADRHTRSAAAIFLAVSIHEFLGGVVGNVLTEPLTRLDASAVTAILSLFLDGVTRVGNVVDNGRDFSLVVVAGCTSVSYVTFGLLTWVTITQAVRPGWRRSDLVMAGVVVMAMVALNQARLVIMGFGLEVYQALHFGMGSEALGFVTTVAAVAISIQGVWHEIRQRGARR